MQESKNHCSWFWNLMEEESTLQFGWQKRQLFGHLTELIPHWSLYLKTCCQWMTRFRWIRKRPMNFSWFWTRMQMIRSNLNTAVNWDTRKRHAGNKRQIRARGQSGGWTQWLKALMTLRSFIEQILQMQTLKLFCKQIVQMQTLTLFCKLYRWIVVSAQKVVCDIKNWERCLKVVNCTDAWVWRVSRIVILLLRLGVDTHHARVTTGN